MSSVTEENLEARTQAVLDTVPDEANREQLRLYIAERRANGIRASTLANDSNHLRDFARFMGDRPFTAAEKGDIVTFINDRVRTRTWRSKRKDGSEAVVQREIRLSDSTMAIRATVVKCFYKWLEGDGEEYPKKVAFLKTNRSQKDTIPTDHLISQEDMRQMLQSTDNPRDRALLAVLYESGMRAGEICALDVGHVLPEIEGTLLRLPKRRQGLKTGARQVRLYADESGHEYLRQWLEAHPDKEDPGAPLFISMSQRAHGTRLRTSALGYITRRAAENAGLKKHVNPHLFRHTCATQRAMWGWNEAKMRAFFGWSRSSDMPSRYTHLAGKDFDEHEMQRRGLRSKEDAGARALPPIECKGCGMHNLPTLLFCGKCSTPLTAEAEKRLEEQRNDALKKVLEAEIDRLRRDDPDILARIVAGLARTEPTT